MTKGFIYLRHRNRRRQNLCDGTAGEKLRQAGYEAGYYKAALSGAVPVTRA